MTPARLPEFPSGEVKFIELRLGYDPAEGMPRAEFDRIAAVLDGMGCPVATFLAAALRRVTREPRGLSSLRLEDEKRP